jgi:type IV secretory pathway VirB10-like protein
MTSTMGGADPRRDLPNEDLSLARDDGQPVVGRAPSGTSPLFVIAVFAVLALALFFLLNARRTHHVSSTLTTSATGALASAPAYDPPPLDITPRAPVAPPVPLVVAPPPPPLPVPHPVTAMPPLAPPVDPSQRRRAPSVVVDLQSPNGTAVAFSAMAASRPTSAVASAQTAAGAGNSALPLAPAVAGAAASPLAAPAQASGLGPYDQFAARASDSPPQPAVATELGNLSAIITQGATIPGVL